MKFKLDENLPQEIADFLRALGYDADSVKEEGLAGSPDGIVLEAARKEERVLLTLDKGIGNIIGYPRDSHHGVVLFRPSSGRGTVALFVRSHFNEVLSRDLKGRITVVSSTGIRVR